MREERRAVRQRAGPAASGFMETKASTMPLSQEVSSWQEAVLTVIMLSANLLESHTIALLWVLRKDRG